jgi:peptidoglycan/xylan/chitin deacetylase (PgdA/CDA1 family)
MSGALLCFYDYDTQWGADRSRSRGGKKSWGHLDFDNTEQLLEMHARYRVPACFAVVGAAALPGERPYHDPRQIRRIHAAGHEVASHSMRHEWLPGLSRQQLLRAIADSKRALEDCVGHAVISFVPPFNQPFDYSRRLSISLAERREAGPERAGLADLCAMLKQSGYSFCRVVYRSLFRRLAERLARRRLDGPVRSETIAGLTCLRLNTPVGFEPPTLRLVERCAATGGFAVVYGHPHSITLEGPQNARYLEPFLKRVAQLRDEGRLQILLPKQLTAPESAR